MAMLAPFSLLTSSPGAVVVEGSAIASASFVGSPEVSSLAMAVARGALSGGTVDGSPADDVGAAAESAAEELVLPVGPPEVHPPSTTMTVTAINPSQEVDVGNKIPRT